QHPRFDVLDVTFAAEPHELVVGELLEQEQLAQFLRAADHGRAARGRYGAHVRSRYRCTSMTAIAPSPTAEATRLADSARTSPAAKTPGTLVSRWNGARSGIHPDGSGDSSEPRSGPLTTNPRPSRTTM